jgi:hypothetical protein
MYFTINNGVFNQYLKKGKEDGPWGQYSLAPIWRFLSKVGFDTYIPQYQPFYLTPSLPTRKLPSRTARRLWCSGCHFWTICTWVVASVLWFQWNKSRRLINLILIGHVYVIICISFLLLATMWGYWLMSLIDGLILASFGDRKLSRVQ